MYHNKHPPLHFVTSFVDIEIEGIISAIFKGRCQGFPPLAVC